MNTLRHRAIRYFWDPEPFNEDPAAMIWCLGQHYDTNIPQPQTEDTTAKPSEVTSDTAISWPVEFLDDFEARVWMTYRTDFPSIPRTPGKLPFTSPSSALLYAGKLLSGHAGEGFSSDVGWGCMIRSAQSVLANALTSLHLGRGNPLPTVFERGC
jgi:cysteine protease ATG4